MRATDPIRSALDRRGLVSLLNDYRISYGRPSLGFLNPFLYSKGVAGLVDIVVRASPPFEVRGIGSCANKIHFGDRVERTPVVVLPDSTRLLVGMR